ncbi:hypothetical protein [Candidatus Spongiihabitans sp.]|uniref:hypothetical protein n=1 Tax=Candidatus Spongiihabitans sp. TaxID=3101308 RepID=UPI003C7052D8
MNKPNTMVLPPAPGPEIRPIHFYTACQVGMSLAFLHQSLAQFYVAELIERTLTGTNRAVSEAEKSIAK